MEEEKKNESASSDGARPWQSYHTVFTNAKAGECAPAAQNSARSVKSRIFEFDNMGSRDSFLGTRS